MKKWGGGHEKWGETRGVVRGRGVKGIKMNGSGEDPTAQEDLRAREDATHPQTNAFLS